MSWSMRREARKETPGGATGCSLSVKPAEKVSNRTQAKVELVDSIGKRMKLFVAALAQKAIEKSLDDFRNVGVR